VSSRKQLLLEVANLPWWSGLVLAGFAYVSLRYMVFALFPPSPAGQDIAREISNIAWPVALAFAGAAFVAAVWQFARGRFLIRQSDLETTMESQATRTQPRIDPTFARYADGEPPTCPKCEKPMVRRTAYQGPYTEEDFWACSNFPKCSGQRPLARF